MQLQSTWSVILSSAALLVSACGGAQPTGPAAAPVTNPNPTPTTEIAENEAEMAPTEPESSPAETPAVLESRIARPMSAALIGRWVSEIDGSVLELTATTYYLKFPFNDGARENHGDLLDHDEQTRVVTLEYTEVMQNGEVVEFEPGERYMLYEIRDGKLYQLVGRSMPDQVSTEPYVKE